MAEAGQPAQPAKEYNQAGRQVFALLPKEGW
jgi:hypothetical protein